MCKVGAHSTVDTVTISAQYSVCSMNTPNVGWNQEDVPISKAALRVTHTQHLRVKPPRLEVSK